MQINSTTPNPMSSHSFNTAGKSSSKNNEIEQRQLDNEIQSLEQKKANLNKQIDSIKGDFAPPKPKDELIRPLKDEIQDINVKIQQKQAEKMKKQAENIKETSNSDENKKSNFAQKNIEGKYTPSSNEEKNKSTLKQLSNLTTQTSVINKAKIKNSLKDFSNLLLKEKILFSDVSNTSKDINSINGKKNNSYMKNAIDAYNLIKNADSVNSTTNMLG